MKILVVIVLLITTQQAIAQEDAQEVFKLGKQAFLKDDFKEAKKQFEKVKLLNPSHTVTFEIRKSAGYGFFIKLLVKGGWFKDFAEFMLKRAETRSIAASEEVDFRALSDFDLTVLLYHAPNEIKESVIIEMCGRASDRKFLEHIMYAYRLRDSGLRRLIQQKVKAKPRYLIGLRRTLHHPRDEVRVSSARLLLDIGNSEFTDALSFALHDKNPGVRMIAARALEKFGTDRALMSLVTGLRDDNRELGFACARALLRITSAFGPLRDDFKQIVEQQRKLTKARKSLSAEQQRHMQAHFKEKQDAIDRSWNLYVGAWWQWYQDNKK